MLASPHDGEHRGALALSLHLFSVRGDHAALAADLVQAGAVAVCCDLLTAEAADTRRGGLRLLCLLCEHGPEDYAYLIVQQPGTVEGAVGLLRDDRVAVLQHATALLWYLSEVEQCRERLVHCGGIPAMARLLQRHLDPTLRHNVSGCLGRMECFDDIACDDGFNVGADGAPTIQWV